MSFTKKVYIIAGFVLVVVAVVLAVLQTISRSTDGDKIALIQPVDRRPVYYPGRTINYSVQFNDQNEKHLKAARRVGLSSPPKNRKSVQYMTKNLVEIKSSSLYCIDDLDNSVPFLTSNAKAQLESVARDFQDILRRNDLPKYRFIVTSVLRTEEDVKNLRKKNINASDKSAHCYGTTVDITYKRFEDLSHGATYVPDENLKLILAQALLNAQRAGNVYVKYEKKQACFHITFRR